MTVPHPHHAHVPNATEFEDQRALWREALANDEGLHSSALDLIKAADGHRFGYQWTWCNTPIIRWPDDIVLMQEMVWGLRPSCVIETGVARGGSLLLSASLMAMTGRRPAVLGIDLRIYQHAREAVAASPWSSDILLWEGDSASLQAREVVVNFIAGHPGPALLVLDSDHTHHHVLQELRSLAPIVEAGSIVAVADTLIERMPPDHYPDRPWGPGNNPLSALGEFLAQDERFAIAQEYNRRGLLSEFRDGIIRRVV